MGCGSFFFNDTATTEIYTLSLHDALPIWGLGRAEARARRALAEGATGPPGVHAASHAESVARGRTPVRHERGWRSEEHTSELQSRQYLVCRLLLEKKK